MVKSRFYKHKSGYGRGQPVIELTVKNNTSIAVSRAYFEGTIASPGRSVPWLVKDFNYEIAGGLEPGEEVTWSLSPNMFSDWGTIETSKDAIFTVTVEQLDGSDGESMYSTRAFSEYDQERLQQLKTKYAAK